MGSNWNVLIASGCLDNRKDLIRILDRLPVNVFVTHNLDEAADVLAKQHVDLVFCDAFLPDGTYRDLMPACPAPNACIVVTAHVWDREAHLEAIRRGAFDTLRFPLQPTDVELIVIRAARERQRVETAQAEPVRMTA